MTGTQMSTPEQFAAARPMVMGITWLFTLVGVGLLIGCAAAVWLRVDFLSTAVETRAEVIAVERVRSPGSSRGGTPTYRPTFAFDVEGERVEATTPYATSAWDWPVGAEVTVRYDAADPTDVLPVSGIFVEWIFQIVLGVLGLFALLMSFGIRAAFKKALGGASGPPATA